MTLRGKLEIIAAIVLLAGGVLAFRSWLSEHDLRLHAEEQAKAQQTVQADAAAKAAELQKQMDVRDQAYTEQLKALDSKLQSATSPQQFAALVSQMAGLKQPIQVVTPAATSQNPNPTPVAQVPEIDFPQAKAYVTDCEQCKLDRAKLQADAADRASQAALAQKQIDSLKQEVNTWQTAAKGGSKWQRMKRAAKWFAIGAGAGAAALCGTGHCK
jgi:hypothetical protein